MARRFSVRLLVVGLLVLGGLAIAAFRDAAPPDFGAPLAGLTNDQLARFNAGKSEFVQVETVAEGLGPVFNDSSCANCHSVPAAGGGSTRLETRFGTLTTGQFDPLTQLGGSLIQSQGIGQFGQCNYVGETVPPEATIIAQRRTTPLFGLGLVDNVPDGTFRLLAAIEALDPDGIAGGDGRSRRVPIP